MRRAISAAVLAGAMLVAGTGLCAAQSYGTQPPPSSHYADGTGNVAVDGLNAGQLDQNYRGPWHPVRPRQSAPVYAAPAYAAPAYPRFAYPPGPNAPPAYNNSYGGRVYPQAGHPQPVAPPPAPIQGGY